MTFIDFFKQVSEREPEREFLILDEAHLSYGEAFKLVKETAESLASIIKKEDRIIILHMSLEKQLIFFLSVIYCGAIAIIANENIGEEKAKELLESIGGKLIIKHDFQLTTKKLVKVVLNEKMIFAGIMSSGTTGKPKIIWRDYKSWINSFKYQSSIFNINTNDKLFIKGDLSYSANLNSIMHIIYMEGTIVSTTHHFPATWIELIKKNKVNSIFMVPVNYDILTKKIEQPINGVGSLVSAGAKLSKNLGEKLMKSFPKAVITEYYGASELGHISYNQGQDIINHGDSLGKVFPEVKLNFKDEVIYVKSPYLAPKYIPEATAGDMGYIDEHGYLYVRGRRDDIINVGGVKIFPQEIEEYILAHPRVKQVMVFPVYSKGRGSQLAAALVCEEKVKYSELKVFLKNKLSMKLIPKKLFYVEELPLTINGKLDRKNSLNYETGNVPFVKDS